MGKAQKGRTSQVSNAERSQSLLLRLAQLFITLPSDNLDEGINKALAEIGEFAEADRSWIIQINKEAGTNTHEWCAPGIPSALEHIQNLPIEAVPWIASKLGSGEVVHVPSLDDLPPEAEPEREICRAQGMKGFLAVPLLYAGTLTGIVGFDLVRESRSFDIDIVNLLKIAGEMLGNAVHRRRVESSKKELDLRFRSVIDNLNEGVSIGDLDDTMMYVNYRYAAMLGYSVEELLGKKAYQFIVPPEEHYKIREGTKRRTHGESDEYECTQIRKDGTRISTIIKASPYRNINGEVIGAISAITDISLKKQTEAENAQLQKRLMHVQKMDAVGQLAAGIAHDLNNSLSAIMGHLQLIKSTPDLPSPSNKSADTALLGCKRASNLINQLLAFSRQGDLKKEDVYLDSIVSETLELVGGIVSKNVQIKSSGAAGHILVQADKSELSQVLTNIIINANHAMPKGGSISFSYSTTSIDFPESFNRDARAGTFAVLTISDTGEGIPSSVLPRVFEPFFTTKGPGIGTGLGLSMAYAIMQRHGGWIEVDSQEGMGTAFSLYFPLVAEKEESRSNSIQRPSMASPKQAQMAVQSGTIMIIDDEPILADLARSFLERAGFQTQAFSVPQDAFVWYKKHFKNVSLILLDMKMPGFNGVQSFDILREICPDAKIVLISGYIDDNEVSRLLNQGALSFIQKPVKYTELVEWISKTVKVSKATDSESFVH